MCALPGCGSCTNRRPIHSASFAILGAIGAHSRQLLYSHSFVVFAFTLVGTRMTPYGSKITFVQPAGKANLASRRELRRLGIDNQLTDCSGWLSDRSQSGCSCDAVATLVRDEPRVRAPCCTASPAASPSRMTPGPAGWLASGRRPAAASEAGMVYPGAAAPGPEPPLLRAAMGAGPACCGSLAADWAKLPPPPPPPPPPAGG